MISEVDMIICFMLGVMTGILISMMIAICIFLDEKDDDQ